MLVKINIRYRGSRTFRPSCKRLTLYSDIASIGALITVLSLAFDPFMQQVIMYEPRAVHKANTTLQRSQYYYDDLPSDSDGVTLGLRAAMYNGLFDNNLAQQISPSCPTGNCTWAPMSSLAMCSTCESLPISTALSCKLTYSGGAYGNSQSQLKCDYKFSKLLNGFTAFGAAVDGGFTGGTPIQVSSLQTYSPLDPFQSTGFVFAGRTNPWSGFARVMLDYTIDLKPTSIDVCAIYPCVKTYNISVAGGAPHSREIDSWASDENWTTASYLAENITLSPPKDRVSESTDDTTFNIDSIAASGILSLLVNSFNGSAYDAAGSSTVPSYTSDIMQALHMTNNLTQLMNNMTASISNHMRTSSLDTAVGQVFATETYVRIRWWWFALPIALAPASCVFLFTAIWASWTGKVEIWKSSGLATMLHGLESIAETNNLERQSGMEEVAKGLNVRLQTTVDGVQRLVGNNGHAAKEHPSPLVARTSVDDSQTAMSSTVQHNNDTAPFVIPRRPVGSLIPVASTNGHG